MPDCVRGKARSWVVFLQLPHIFPPNSSPICEGRQDFSSPNKRILSRRKLDTYILIYLSENQSPNSDLPMNESKDICIKTKLHPSSKNLYGKKNKDAWGSG